jgi:hypothetical protein
MEKKQYTEPGIEELSPEALEELSNGKGDDEDGQA